MNNRIIGGSINKCPTLSSIVSQVVFTLHQYINLAIVISFLEIKYIYQKLSCS